MFQYFYYDLTMKLKLFIRLYSSSILIFTYFIVLYQNIFSFLMAMILYYLILKEYNRIGFLNNKLFFYISLNLALLIMTYGLTSLILYLEISLFMMGLFLHIPHRAKIRKILNKIKVNLEVHIYHNRIDFLDTNIYYGFDIDEIELMWLSHQILLRSKCLNKEEIVYINNESIENHFFVKIS